MMGKFTGKPDHFVGKNHSFGSDFPLNQSIEYIYNMSTERDLGGTTLQNLLKRSIFTV